MRSKAIRVECKLDLLSSEAHDWLDNHTQDLAFTSYRFRIWTRDKLEEELSGRERVEKRFYSRAGFAGTWRCPQVSDYMDAVFFASQADAVYFKMTFL